MSRPIISTPNRSAWLEQHLKRYAGTVIAVTHDRYFLDNVAGWILELDRGEGIPWKGNYTGWLEQKKARLEVEEKTESARQKLLARELEWVRQSPPARQAKSKARLQAYESMLDPGLREKEKEIEIYIPPGPRLGIEVIEAIEADQGDSEIACWTKDSTSRCRRAESSASSGPMARAKPRSSA